MYFYNARYYDPSLGRFLQADTIVPSPANPQSLNRYAYALNNPLRYTDPTGHACDPLDGMNGGGGAVAGVAVIKIFEALSADGDPTNEVVAIAQAVSADGDPTNEVQTVVNTLCGGDCGDEISSAGQTARSVWEQNPLQRGVEIENTLGRSSELSQNFPVIDRFQNGVATSIKSIDLGAKSYQNIGTLTSKVTGYVNSLRNWRGADWAKVNITNAQITERELLLAIPPGATEAQMAALQELQQWATSVNVTLNITVVP